MSNKANNALEQCFKPFEETWIDSCKKYCASGMSVMAWACSVGLTSVELRHWAKEHPSFALALLFAKQLSEVGLESIAFENLNNPDFQAGLYATICRNREGKRRLKASNNGARNTVGSESSDASLERARVYQAQIAAQGVAVAVDCEKDEEFISGFLPNKRHLD